MVRRISIGVLTLFCLTIGCKGDRSAAPGRHAQIAAADALTKRYASSRLASWQLRASAAGRDCAVLFVQTPIVLEDSMVEAMHYGGGAYGVYAGGVRQFVRDRAFRGVAYKDASGRIWTYGVAPHEAEELVPCH